MQTNDLPVYFIIESQQPINLLHECLRKLLLLGPNRLAKALYAKNWPNTINTLWCPEYAREYLTVHGMNYTYEDLLTIARAQIELEEKYEAEITGHKVTVKSEKGSLTTRTSQLTTHHSLLFIDTDMYVMKVWCEFVFGKCHPFILDQIAKRKYDLYLLCDIDLPWTYDKLREYPDPGPRQQLYEIYKNLHRKSIHALGRSKWKL